MEKPILPKVLAILIALSMVQCSNPSKTTDPSMNSEIKVAHLGELDTKSFEDLKAAFVQANPGYDLHYFPSTQALSGVEKERVVFIQTGGGTATLSSGSHSKFSIGDIILLTHEESIQTDSLASFLVFTVPEKAPAGIPSFIRPDWDENITDTPGGCATETNAYRRILLTWLSKVGPYQYHAINAHRVRIMDSFSHYHPKEGGFDEFYLVQMAQKKARIITSSRVDLVENPTAVNLEQAQNLLQSTSLKVGDLVYLPRGVVHRGIGGVLAQVITVPGFIPGSEIGVDHHLRKINEELGLSGDMQLPFNEAASEGPVVK